MLHDFYASLLYLHSNNPALRAGDPSAETYILKTTNPENIVAYLRKKGNHEVLVVLNFSVTNQLHFEIVDDHLSGDFKNIFSGVSINFSASKHLQMQAWEYFVFQK
jgi:glycosidase